MSAVWTPPCEYIVGSKVRGDDGVVRDHTFYCVRHGLDTTATGAPCAENPI